MLHTDPTPGEGQDRVTTVLTLCPTNVGDGFFHYFAIASSRGPLSTVTVFLDGVACGNVQGVTVQPPFFVNVDSTIPMTIDITRLQVVRLPDFDIMQHYLNQSQPN